VGDVMNAQAHTCLASTSLPEAARLLNDRRVQRLFVVDEGGTMVGVLTRGDVVRALAEAA
jgi:CBS domain-containing protein